MSFYHVQDFQNLAFWIFRQIWEQADGLIIISESQILNVNAKLSGNAVLFGELADFLDAIVFLELHEGVEVLPCFFYDVVVHVHHQTHRAASRRTTHALELFILSLF